MIINDAACMPIPCASLVRHVPSPWLSVLLVPFVSAVAQLPAAVHVLYAVVLSVLLSARPRPLSLQPAVNTSHLTFSLHYNPSTTVSELVDIYHHHHHHHHHHQRISSRRKS